MRVETGARLHLGFIDPFGESGRRYGSAGIYLEEPKFVLDIWRDEGIKVEGSKEIEERVKEILERLSIPGLRVRVHSDIPAHIGLGSGTQLTLALGLTAQKLYNLNIRLDELALKLGRCRRSAAGFWLFLYGGFVVEAGHGGGSGIPPLLMRMKFPREWKIILLTPTETGRGLHGELEEEGLQELEVSGGLSAGGIVLMKLLPSILERDFERFVEAVEKLDKLNGTWFSRIQGGVYSEESLEAVDALRAAEVRGVGQSSWGPTVYGFAEGEDEAEKAVERIGKLKDWSIRVVEARNRGVEISGNPDGIP